MQTKFHLESGDFIAGSSHGLTVFDRASEPQGDGILAILFPIDAEARLRLCDQIAEGLEDVRHAALAELSPKRA